MSYISPLLFYMKKTTPKRGINSKGSKGVIDLSKHEIMDSPKVEDIKEVMDNPDENIHHEEGDD